MQKGNDLLLAEKAKKKKKKLGGHRLRFGEDMPGTYPKSVKSVFVSEQGHSVCKP